MWLLLLAQLAQPAPPAAPAKPGATGGAATPTQPTQPTQPSAAGAPPPVVDPRTTAPEGAGALPLDPRTTRDEQHDPRAAAQVEEERREAAARVLRTQEAALAGSRVRLVDPTGRPVQHRPLEITTGASLVAGYNSNVFQNGVVGTQVPGVFLPAGDARPAMYNSLEGRLQLDIWGKGDEPQQLGFQVLGTQYYKLDDGPAHPQDGSLVGYYTAGFPIGRTTKFGVYLLSSVQTLNATRQQDGAVAAVPIGQQQRTYTLSTLALRVQQEISPTTRYVHVGAVTASTVLRDEPVPLLDGSRFFHRGLDYVTFTSTGSLQHDFGLKWRGSADVEYEGNYNNFFLDFTRRVPVRRGDFSQHVGRAYVGAAYFATDALSFGARAGAAVSSPPPVTQPLPAPTAPIPPDQLDPNDRSLVVSPTGSAEVIYLKPTFDAALIATYTLGSANARLGYGRTTAVDAVVGGVPFPSDRTLKNFSVLVTGSFSRAVLRPTETDLAFLTYISTSLTVRYRVTTWLGILGGYTNRYVNSAGTLAAPDFTRHQVFLGVSGFFTTDTTEPPPLSVFAPPRPTG